MMGRLSDFNNVIDLHGDILESLLRGKLSVRAKKNLVKDSRNNLTTCTTKYRKLNETVLFNCKNCGQTSNKGTWEQGGLRMRGGLEEKETGGIHTGWENDGLSMGEKQGTMMGKNPKHFLTWSASKANHRFQKMSKSLVNSVTKFQLRMEKVIQVSTSGNVANYNNNNNDVSSSNKNCGVNHYSVNLNFEPDPGDPSEGGYGGLRFKDRTGYIKNYDGAEKRQSTSSAASYSSSAHLMTNMAKQYASPESKVHFNSTQDDLENCRSVFPPGIQNARIVCTKSNVGSGTYSTKMKMGYGGVVNGAGVWSTQINEEDDQLFYSGSDCGGRSSCSQRQVGVGAGNPRTPNSSDASLIRAPNDVAGAGEDNNDSGDPRVLKRIATIGVRTKPVVRPDLLESKRMHLDIVDSAQISNDIEAVVVGNSKKFDEENDETCDNEKTLICCSSNDKDVGVGVSSQKLMNNGNCENQRNASNRCRQSYTNSLIRWRRNGIMILRGSESSGTMPLLKNGEQQCGLSSAERPPASSLMSPSVASTIRMEDQSCFQSPIDCMNFEMRLNVEEEKELKGASWFQAGIPREIALEVLKSAPIGNFIVRNSTTKSGCFALSLKVPQEFHPSGIAHYLILRTSKGYKIKGFTKEFSSLKSLITHHSVMPEAFPCTLSLDRLSKRCSERFISRSQSGDFMEPEKLITTKCTSRLFTDL